MKREKLWNKLTEDLSAVISQPVVEIVGTGRVLVENHKGIIEYETDCIGIRMTYGVLKIQGCDLELVQITSQQLVVTGNVEAIFLNGGAFHSEKPK